MRNNSALALIFSLALPLAAHAATLDQLSFTGLDSSNNPYAIDVAIDPTVASGTTGMGFFYNGVAGTLNGVSDSFILSVNPGVNFDAVQIGDAGSFFQYFEINANGTTPFLAGDPTLGGAPVITLGSYTGQSITSCLSVNRAPALALPGSAALAFAALPSISIDCAASVNLAVTSSSASVTPEPSTLGLLSTGVLGVAGVLRRRFTHSKLPVGI